MVLIQPFSRLQVSAVCANLADGMSLVTFPLLAASHTSSPLAIGTVSAARSLPWLLTSVHVGVLIDRKGPGRLLFASNAVRVVVFLALVLLVLLPTGVFLPCLTVVAFAVGALEVVADNSTQTFIPHVVPNERLPSANARIQLIENTGLNLVGAPVASILTSVHPMAPLIAISAKYSLAAAALRELVNRKNAVQQPARKASVLAGWAYLRRSRLLFTLALSTSLTNLSAAGAAALLVLYVEQQLHAPVWSYGLLLTALAAGTFLGAALAPRALARTNESVVLRAVLIVKPVPLLVIALATHFWLAAVAQVAYGVLEITWGIVAVSFRQEVVPPDLLGRVNAAYRMVAWGSIPVGGLLAGVLAELAGIQWAYLSFAAVLCLGWLVATAIPPEVFERERLLPVTQEVGEAA